MGNTSFSADTCIGSKVVNYNPIYDHSEDYTLDLEENALKDEFKYNSVELFVDQNNKKYLLFKNVSFILDYITQEEEKAQLCILYLDKYNKKTETIPVFCYHEGTFEYLYPPMTKKSYKIAKTIRKYLINLDNVNIMNYY